MLPGRQCVSLSTVVAMFLCCTRHFVSSSMEQVSCEGGGQVSFPDRTAGISRKLWTHLFAIFLETSVGFNHLSLQRQNNPLEPRSAVRSWTVQPGRPTFSFWASPRTFSSSVMESTKPWKWWLHIFSISLSWFLMRTSSFSMKRPCSCPSYTDLTENNVYHPVRESKLLLLLEIQLNLD